MCVCCGRIMEKVVIMVTRQKTITRGTQQQQKMAAGRCLPPAYKALLSILNTACWHWPAMPALGKQEQENSQFKVISGYVASLGIVCASWAPVSEKPKK